MPDSSERIRAWFFMQDSLYGTKLGPVGFADPNYRVSVSVDWATELLIIVLTGGRSEVIVNLQSAAFMINGSVV